ncbi:hypothetical protein PIB30_053189 [Stylosanthes scabra]|uniref:Uncharacterized protein n=1 Tax=Stylosanthes scabra TaxID=79078 RepID=A0ABU6XG62_9FABA|nr:hypothetical protein [Stylosanthes scabra]
MAYEKPFLDLKLSVEDVILVKPSKPTPSSVLSLSTIDNRPELHSLCQTIHIFEPSNNIILNDDPALVIKEALSNALFYYYPLAGRLVKHADGKLRIHCNAFGVPFVEAIANCKLSCLHYLDGSDTENAKHLAFDNPFHEDDNENCYQYPLGIKVTKFLCGGFTVGIGASHAVFDGYGGSQFFQAIAELASGKSEPSVKPVWERERLNGSITEHPLQSSMDEELNEKPLSHVVKMIKETKKLGFSRQYIMNAVDTKETESEHFDYQGIGASMVLSNWMHLGMLENMDIGWAKPVNMIPAPCNMFGTVGVCIFSAPSDLDPSMNGGVRIFVSLPSDAMPKFKEEMELLLLVKP